MARGNQLIRQWKIVRILQCCRYGRTIAELCTELGCSLRTVYRDMEVLQSAGFPLYCEIRDSGRHWLMMPMIESRAVEHALPPVGQFFEESPVSRQWAPSTPYPQARPLISKAHNPA